MSARMVKPEQLRRDLQVRAAIDAETVSRYSELMTEGTVFPPVVVFVDADGVPYAGEPIRLPVGDNLRRPWCHNRPDYPAGTWEPQRGYHDVMTGAKPRYRWRPNKMSSDCKAWACAPTETPAPVLTRWDCRGCRHMPERARQHFGETR